MESNINSYKLVQKNIQYTLTTSMIGESIKLSVRNDSNPGADLNRTFTVAGLKQLDELFNVINTPIEALQWIDKALRKEKVRIDGVGSSLKLVFYITTNGIGHQIEIPMIENTQAIYGQEIKTTDFLSENSIRASQAALATLTANTSITKTTMPTLEEFNREIGLDSTKIVRQTLNANTNELIQSIEDAEKKNYLINTSENVNINVSLPVTTENINTNLESTAFDLNTFQETNNQIQVGATDANIDLGQYTTTTNEQIDIANYTDSTNYNVEEINTQYLQGENNYSEQLNIENINTFDMNQVNLPIETGNVDVGTNFEVGTNVEVGTNIESLPFIAPADDNIEQINQYTTATESTPIDINFGNLEQGATTTTNYEEFQTETTNDAQFDIQNLINTGLTTEEVGSTNIETQYIQEVEASDPSTEIQSLRAKVNELMGLKSQFDELEKLKAQLSEIENMQDHTEELNQLKAKVEELANAQKLKQEDNDTILLKKKIEELEEFKAKYEEEINALKGSEEKIETKIETSSKESNDIIKEETTQKYSVKGDIIHDPKELELITRKINKINQKITLNLIYKATIDSDRAEAFHEKCDQAQCSLVLVETDKGKRFGGFTTCSWKGDCVEKKDPDAFVFSLDKMETYENIEDEDAIGCYPKYGPVFLGCQIKINDNAFSKGGTTFEKGMNYNTQEDYELTGGDRVFGVKEVEVYDVIID